MSIKPYFSIIIPTYNRSILLKKLLDSILLQTFQDFEVLVIDDGGNDNSEEVVYSFNDKRFRYYKKENGGVSSARNFGLLYASGKYINFFDSDDLAYPNHLQEAYNFFTINEKANVLVFDYEWGNADKSNYKTVTNKYKDLNTAILKGNFISTNSIFILKTAIGELRFNEQLTVSEDWEYWLKLSFFNKFYAVNIVTTYVVEHEQRSLKSINLLDLIRQRDIFLNSLADYKMLEKKEFNIIDSHFCSFIALNASLLSNKRLAVEYFIRSIQLSKISIFSRRSLAITKHLLIK